MEATPHAHETVLEVEAPRVKFGRGAIEEVGAEAAALGLRRVALFTDRRLAGLEFVERARRSLRDAGVDVAEFADVRIEPTDASFRTAAAFAADARPDGYVSVGGGSVIDTAKAANLYATYPAPFERYVNAPLGEGAPVPGPLAPHIACPTTSGTGSECTGIAIFDFVERGVKTGIASRRLRPALGIVDPDATRTLPAAVVASSGFDVLAHALESFTARPYTQRAQPTSPLARPLSQGANPYSDLACTEALRLLGDHLERAVHDAHDDDAREAVMYAATLAGIGFGNAGVHVPHGMAYAIAGQVHDFVPDGYDADHAMVPHGMSVIVSAPAAARFTASTAPEKHRHAAMLLGAERTKYDDEIGDALAAALARLMRVTAMPNGLRALGYGDADVGALVDGAFAQQRLLANAPRPVTREDLAALFTEAMTVW
ncbi:MAG: iron-containing alcohol dehydrogenase [Candidatus Eremiobacteraeota bacterium]|nr:iron-containing alcohol dehydrogenase [Candidatus Eremiobacteraeota bacterium]MBV9409783.1 iron-containing alcohol dehydrogenase [Candidatus Eremiobacteraeota bacterium]